MKNTITVLLTNDDGIDAPGIKALMQVFGSCENVTLWTVAPDRPRSTTSHGMSISRPVYAEKKGERTYAVEGLPVDCVYLALFHLMDTEPDVVVSGINNGANLGRDVIYSGTVACAREAALDGIHGVASSLVNGNDYELAAKSTAEIALQVAKMDTPPILLNLNYPDGPFKGPRFGNLGVRDYPRVVSRRTAPLFKRDYFWLGGPEIEDEEVPGSDGWLIKNKTASATLLILDQTDFVGMNRASEALTFIEPPEKSQ